MLICGDDFGHGCDRGYHIGCLDPPLPALPPQDQPWFCGECRRDPKTGEATFYTPPHVPPKRVPKRKSRGAARVVHCVECYLMRAARCGCRNGGRGGEARADSKRDQSAAGAGERLHRRQHTEKPHRCEGLDTRCEYIPTHRMSDRLARAPHAPLQR
eukprot:341753-Prorocentrum_minimum.AAC.3